MRNKTKEITTATMPTKKQMYLQQNMTKESPILTEARKIISAIHTGNSNIDIAVLENGDLAIAQGEDGILLLQQNTQRQRDIRISAKCSNIITGDGTNITALDIDNHTIRMFDKDGKSRENIVFKQSVHCIASTKDNTIVIIHNGQKAEVTYITYIDFENCEALLTIPLKINSIIPHIAINSKNTVIVPYDDNNLVGINLDIQDVVFTYDQRAQGGRELKEYSLPNHLSPHVVAITIYMLVMFSKTRKNVLIWSNLIT
ncbi:unnamed protein product [Owenia fusiformis]|uniref:Uncharacterized protein n=1 Tax=Owenia fusiformis TaxID=6347 RepID=A0A8S4NY61_OWEFU|nr:unnamed protein product [Owenia fusiformis]